MKTKTFLIAFLLLPLIAFSQTVNIGDILCTDGSTVKPEQYVSSGKIADGIVFFVDDNSREGWAVSLEFQATNTNWVTPEYYYEMYDIPLLENFEYSREAMYDFDGYNNTDIIRSAHGADWYPAAWCVDFDHGWYLPSAGQMRWLIAYMNEINNSLTAVGGTLFVFDQPRWYWTSTERTEAHAVVLSQTGSVGNYPKWNYIGEYEIGVRAVKTFTVQAPSYHIGEIVTTPSGQKGVVFYISPEDDSYWLVAMNDLTGTYKWGPETDIADLVNYNPNDQFVALHGVHCGYDATSSMREAMGASSPYASSHIDFANGWHIPSVGQLSKLYAALPFIESTLTNNGGATLSGNYYWSSTESASNNAWAINFGANLYTEGFLKDYNKTSQLRVRPIWSEPCVTPTPEPTIPDNILESDCNHPMEGMAWDVKLIHSTPEVVASYAPVMAGDIDSNGIVDILISHFNGNNYRTNTLDVYSGIDLSLQYRFNIQDSIYNTTGNYALCRYPLPNGSQQGAIFVHSYDGKIRSYAIDGTLLNVSDRATSCEGMVSFADFNGDGFPEVYAGSDIFDAATLKWLCSGPESGNKGLSYRGSAPGVVNSHRCYYAMSLAADVLGDATQELICGNTIYDVNITSRTNPALNAITVNKTITPPSGYTPDGHVSLADFDLDGECEVLVTRNNTDDHTMGMVYFYAYKPSNGQIIFQKTVPCLCTGYPLIGNIDDDPHPEIVFLEKQESWQPMYIYCWRYTTPTGLTTVWQHQHDDLSGQTGITLFDFNQDDIMELVYRDSENLRIINGSGKSHITGNDTIRPYNIFTRMMAAGTGCEYPIVADVNSDGSAEIVVSGMLDQYAYLPGVGGLHMFGNPGNWAPARPVWNQYMYHVTNVNEDLTIPTYCFDKATVFTGSDGTLRRPYNNFLQQAGYITPTGEPYNPDGMVEIEHYGEGCETYTYHGVTYTESGDYEYLIENPTGCDTLLNIHVHLGDTIHNYLYKAACDSYTWNGTTYTESGLYEQTFTSAQGCDSIVILDLTIGASSYVSPIHGESLIYYQTNGQYTYSIAPVEGCFGYEWSIDGPWTIQFSPDSPVCIVNITSPGTATLKVRVYTSCGSVERTLFINHDARPDIVIYPNPTQGEFNIVLYGMEGEAIVVIYDYLGQLIGRFRVDADIHGTLVPYSLAGKAAGIYMVSAINRYHKVTKKVIKSTPSSFGIFNWDW